MLSNKNRQRFGVLFVSMEYSSKRITLRIPADLHEQLIHEAEETSKSMNAEVVARLKGSFNNDGVKYQLSEDQLNVMIDRAIKKALSTKKK